MSLATEAFALFPFARPCPPGAGPGPHSPFTGAPIDAAEADSIRSDWARWIAANQDIAVACGISWWKRARIAHFLWAERPLAFADTAEAALAQAGAARIAAWPSRAPAGLPGDRLVRVEDGFIRSIGLGAALHPPLSIVIDAEGIYYDPRTPSALETILATADFTPDLTARAAWLRERIVAGGISKYGVAPAPSLARVRDGRRVVLVAGQVEDDESVRTGGAGVAGNLDLLKRARAAEPGAEILFRPHPDVDAGHRKGQIVDAEALAFADAVVRRGSMPELLAQVDGVHVLTSLTGYEALLRGRDVTTHGQPFFAGWGLTRDLAPAIERRTRRLTLDQLVAGTLILYPRYIDPVTELPCPPEILLDRFAEGWRPKTTWLIRARQLQGRLFKLFGRTTD